MGSRELRQRSSNYHVFYKHVIYMATAPLTTYSKAAMDTFHCRQNIEWTPVVDKRRKRKESFHLRHCHEERSCQHIHSLYIRYGVAMLKEIRERVITCPYKSIQ